MKKIIIISLLAFSTLSLQAAVKDISDQKLYEKGEGKHSLYEAKNRFTKRLDKSKTGTLKCVSDASTFDALHSCKRAYVLKEQAEFSLESK